MHLKRLTDWVVVLLSGTILLAIIYGAWCDLIDGRLYKPVLEFGARFKGPTHLIVNRTGTPLPIYHPGEMVYARVALQKQRNITGVIQWSLINHDLKQFPSRDGSLPVGVYDQIVPIERIPLDAEIGEHWFAGTVKYKVNWLSTVPFDIWTDKFLVVRKKS